MSEQQNAEYREVFELTESLCSGELTPAQASRLEWLVTNDKECRRLYIRHMHLHASLGNCPINDDTSPSGPASPLVEPSQDPLSLEPPTSPLLGFLGGFYQWGATFLSSNTVRLSLAMSPLVVIIVSLILVIWTVSHYESIPGNSVSEPAVALRYVAQLTGATDCEWSDPNSAPSSGSFLFPDESLDLKSGLVEVVFNDGAKVILQGPAMFTPTSRSAGRLKLGRLTAKVPKQAIGFTINTPTARVVDLGTEFGVDVDHQGATTSHVFRGSISIETPEADKKNSENAIVLHKGDSARSRIAENEKSVIHLTAVEPVKFIRSLPKRVPIKLYNTGIGQKEGKYDAHWEVFAASNDPNFEPQPAFIKPNISRYWWANDSESKWISLATDAQGDTSYKFRTTFDLTGADPTTAMLTGAFNADNQLRVIRLNGHEIFRSQSVSKRPVPSKTFSEFKATSGFVEGTNTLEFDVEKYTIEGPIRTNQLGLRVKMQGSALEKEGTE